MKHSDSSGRAAVNNNNNNTLHDMLAPPEMFFSNFETTPELHVIRALHQLVWCMPECEAAPGITSITSLHLSKKGRFLYDPNNCVEDNNLFFCLCLAYSVDAAMSDREKLHS